MLQESLWTPEVKGSAGNLQESQLLPRLMFMNLFIPMVPHPLRLLTPFLILFPASLSINPSQRVLHCWERCCEYLCYREMKVALHLK